MGKSLGAAGESRDVHNLSPAGQRSVAFCIEVRGLTGAWRRRWVYQSYSYTTLSREPWVTLNYCQLLKPGPVPVAFMLSVVLLTNTRRAPGTVLGVEFTTQIYSCKFRALGWKRTGY